MADRTPALILAAGLGTRLHPLTLVRAKPAIPLAGEPIVRRMVRWLVNHDVHDVVVNLHHRPVTLTRVLGDGSDLDARIRYSWEHPTVLGSAGGPRQALGILGADRFFIVNGDVLTDVDLRALESDHLRNGAQVTMALTPNREPLKYGGVQLDAQLRVTRFVKRGPAAAGSFHFIGPQITNAPVFQSIAEGAVAHTVGGVYDRLIAANPGAVRGFIWDRPFLDIGTVDDYVRCSRAIAPDAGANGTSRIDPAARVRNSIIWDDVTVAAGATVDGCILTDGVSVAPGGQFRDQILVANTVEPGVLAFPIGPLS